MIETVWAFLQFSLIVALISSTLKVIVTVFRLSKVDEETFNAFKEFNEARIEYVAARNSTTRLVISRLLYFVPGHAVMMNIVFIYHALMHEGTYGIIKGIVASEKLSFVPLIRYKFKHIKI